MADLSERTDVREWANERARIMLAILGAAATGENVSYVADLLVMARERGMGDCESGHEERTPPAGSEGSEL